MSEQKPNLYQKLLAITDEIGKIEKTGRNQQQGYSFIEQAQVVAELRPQLIKHGVFIIPETVSRSVERHEVTRSNGKPGVDVHVNVISRYTVIDADNPDDRFVSEWDGGEAIDSGDKATNKATTASHKYFLMKLFNISDKDDADAESPEASTAGYVTYNSSPALKPAASGSTYVSEAQVKLLLARTRDASGKTDKAEILKYFTDKFGIAPNQVKKSEVDEILQRLKGEQEGES